MRAPPGPAGAAHRERRAAADEHARDPGDAADPGGTARARAPCPRRPSAGPPCVVHWVRAEDGPDTPPSGTEIGVRCVKGACLTQHYPSSGAR